MKSRWMSNGYSFFSSASMARGATFSRQSLRTVSRAILFSSVSIEGHAVPPGSISPPL